AVNAAAVWHTSLQGPRRYSTVPSSDSFRRPQRFAHIQTSKDIGEALSPGVIDGPAVHRGS
ncbi:MAG TPA: hypothetical protein VE690_10085, partial [Rhodopila sp.]|nr:hypothetical protein [Rhodopila sp.]